MASTGPSGSCAATSDSTSAYAAGSCGLSASPCPRRSMATTSRPASRSRSIQPLSPHVRAADVANPWTRTTGGSVTRAILRGCGGRVAGQPVAADPARRARVAVPAERRSGRPARQPVEHASRGPVRHRRVAVARAAAASPAARAVRPVDPCRRGRRAIAAAQPRARAATARGTVASRAARRQGAAPDCAYGGSTPASSGTEASTGSAEATAASTDCERRVTRFARSQSQSTTTRPTRNATASQPNWWIADSFVGPLECGRRLRVRLTGEHVQPAQRRAARANRSRATSARAGDRAATPTAIAVTLRPRVR